MQQAGPGTPRFNGGEKQVKTANKNRTSHLPRNTMIDKYGIH